MLTSSSLLSTSSTASGHSGGQIGRTSSGSFKFPSPQYRSGALVQKSKVVDVQEKEAWKAIKQLRKQGGRQCQNRADDRGSMRSTGCLPWLPIFWGANKAKQRSMKEPAVPCGR
eukprot:Tamp_23193.p2 GENE.Tamp_23193~~Tamp_23193.p2  ORF type:complete len:114 (+),score=11.11 Tamp_23193:321-662(+)